MIDLPTGQRPRERALAGDIQSLNDAELVALVLRQGTRLDNALALAYALLARFGSVASLGRASSRELAMTNGMGVAKSTGLAGAFELARRVDRSVEAQCINGPHDVFDVVRASMWNLSRERLLVIVCDPSNRVRDVVKVSDGASDHTLLPVREILNAVLKIDGRAFAIAHNHPSGDPTPSEHDRTATRQLRTAASIVGLRMLDHVVVAGVRWARVA